MAEKTTTNKENMFSDPRDDCDCCMFWCQNPDKLAKLEEIKKMKEDEANQVKQENVKKTTTDKKNIFNDPRNNCDCCKNGFWCMKTKLL